MRVCVTTSRETITGDTIAIRPNLERPFRMLDDDGRTRTIYPKNATVEVLAADLRPAGWYVHGGFDFLLDAPVT
jgi:hypothetical protein